MATVIKIMPAQTSFADLGQGAYFQRPDGSLWIKLDSVNGHSFSTEINEAIDGSELEYLIAPADVTVTYHAP